MNYHRASLFFAGLTCATVFAGCRGTASSDTIPTEKIFADVLVSDDGGGSIHIDVDLQVRSPDDDRWIKLAGGDRLKATLGGQTVVFDPDGGGTYHGYFDRTNAADVNVSLDRKKFEDAPNSSGRMPDPLEIEGIAGAFISRSWDSVIIELAETEDEKSVEISGPCISTEYFDIGPAGADIVLDSGALYSPDPYAECEVSIAVTTTSYGAPDPALHPQSRVVLERTRSTWFYSVP